MIRTAIGIMAFNEEGNIGRLLEKLTSQKLKKVRMAEIIVVASGCTDQTKEIVKKEARKHKQIKLIVQEKRLGKASAINLFLRKTKSPVLVMISADTLPQENMIEKLVSPFEDRQVGMTSAHIIPTNKPNTFMGFYNVVFWKLHHEIAKAGFKAGEAIAWRNIIFKINNRTSTDETNICALILQKGLKTVYVSQAIVYNRGPESLIDFIKVRRRHIAAYYHLREVVKTTYIPDTMDNLMVLKFFIKTADPKNLKDLVWLLGVVATEALGKFLAWYDWRIKREHHPVWSAAASTKILPKNI
jgi:poly-beta-1,6-N-acetyl-D-glucosamine synthase